YSFSNRSINRSLEINRDNPRPVVSESHEESGSARNLRGSPRFTKLPEFSESCVIITAKGTSEWWVVRPSDCSTPMGTQGLRLFAPSILSASGCPLSPNRGEFYVSDLNSMIFRLWQNFALPSLAAFYPPHPFASGSARSYRDFRL